MPDVQLPDVIREELGLITSFSQTIGYQISKHNIPDIWEQTQGEYVKVAVLDTGCQRDHVDFEGDIEQGHNPTSGNSVAFYQGKIRQTKNKNKRRKLQGKINKVLANVTDVDGHGTHCTGIITANNNTIGIVGVAPKAAVLPIKVLGDNGSGSFRDVIQGINHAVALKADVISMSLGSSSGMPELQQAIRRAYNKGIPVICAAGNAGTTTLDYPAKYTETIAVGALDRNNLRASFSQMGPNLDFMAPGVDIISTIPGNRYASMSGTSMATPWLAGMVALMIAKHRTHGGRTPINNVEDVREHLKKICLDLARAGKDNETGYGIVDAQLALNEWVETLTTEERLKVLEERVTRLENSP